MNPEQVTVLHTAAPGREAGRHQCVSYSTNRTDSGSSSSGMDWTTYFNSLGWWRQDTEPCGAADQVADVSYAEIFWSCSRITEIQVSPRNANALLTCCCHSTAVGTCVRAVRIAVTTVLACVCACARTY
jgi:hypothetical protein